MWEPLSILVMTCTCYAIRIDRFEQRVIVALRWDSSLTINYYEGKSLLEEYYKKKKKEEIKKFFKDFKKKLNKKI